MKIQLLLFILCMTLCFHVGIVLAKDPSMQNQPTSDPAIQNRDDNPINAESYSSGRGSYRSPGGSFSGGNRGGISPGYRTGPRAPSSDVSRRQPSTGQPGSAFGRWGGFLGGVAAGSLIGHLLNPFAGFGYGNGSAGYSFLSLLFWALILYLGYKLFQKFRRRNR